MIKRKGVYLLVRKGRNQKIVYCSLKHMNITFRGQRVYRPVDVGMVAAQGGGTIVTGDMQDDMSFYEVIIMF